MYALSYNFLLSPHALNPSHEWQSQADTWSVEMNEMNIFKKKSTLYEIVEEIRQG